MSPKTKEQYEEIRRRSQDMIKEVALDLFARFGYHSTSISQIAKAAGVSKGLMYNYFESKEALLHTIIMEAVDVGDRIIDENFAAADPREQLRGLTEASFRYVRENFDYWKLLVALSLQPDVLREMEPLMQRKQEETLRQMEELFRKLGAPDPRRQTLFYGAVLDGVVLQYLHMREKYPLEEMKEYIFRQFNID